MNRTLYHRLQPIIRRTHFRRTMMALNFLWMTSALLVGVLIYLNYAGILEVDGWWLPLVLTVAAAGIVTAIFTRRSKHDFSNAVNRLEHQFPDLDATLVTAIEQQSDAGQPLGFLQQDVVRKAINHSFSNNWKSIVPAWQLFFAFISSFGSLLMLAAAIFLMVWFAKPIPVDTALQFSDVAVGNVDFEITVEPGNTEIERGKSLLVLARFSDSIPPDSVLVVSSGDDETIRLPMNKSLDDPVFGARISSVSQPVMYWIEFAEQQSDRFDVSVFDYPELVRTDAHLDFPDYTKMENKTVQDVRRVSAVQGTKVEFSFFVNKEVESAILEPIGSNPPANGGADSDNNSPAASSTGSANIQLKRDATDSRKMVAIVNMDSSAKFELKLVDADGRENRIAPKLILNVLENRVPDLKLTTPRRDVQVSAIEELALAATAWDDFGINSVGVSYAIAGKTQIETVLMTEAAAKQKHAIDHLLEFESLNAQPDELLSYFFWAEDFGPDGQPRRVQSDMFFAEVRHFEEIFRQGQAPANQPPGQQPPPTSQSAAQAQELAELQKRIINATWTLIRRENRTVVTPEFEADTQLLAESQSSAIEQLKALAEKVEDPTSRSHIDAAANHMNEAVVHLTEAKTSSNVDVLKTALSSEQAAYQGLLKLRAREHEVVRAQQQQGQSSKPNNRSQQQMQQLNLKDDENRYENEKTAQDPQESEQQREDRQVLSRLRELARRQDDLNDQIKELQSALEKTETQEEKEEIQRRLKSLRDQQEQMLRDTDELLDRMQQPENQQRMSEEAAQLEQTRENLRKASEALKEGQTSRAAADGTRAQRDLEELRDEFQNRTAGQFTQQMRQMRNEAQELERTEQEIGEELAETVRADALGEKKPSPEATPTLRDDENDSNNLDKRLREQQEAVENLRQQMRETIEEAETFEPLLAEQLYETYRRSEQSRPDQSLESARESLQRGWADDAQIEERKAAEGISEMRDGIDEAAESVLGDETEALRAAQNTLRELNDQLKQELNRATGQGEEGEVEELGDQSRQDSQNRDSENGDSDSNDSDNPDGTKSEAESGQSPNSQNGEQSDRQTGQGTESKDSQESNAKSEKDNGQEPGGGQQPGNQPGEGQSEGQNEGQGQSEGQGQNEGQGSGRGDRDPNNPDSTNPPERSGSSNPGENGRGENADELLDRLAQPGNENPRGGMNVTGGGNLEMMQPISGAGYRQWNDKLRDVEEMIADPDLRSQAASIRDQAKQIRREMKRHSAEPNWNLVKLRVAQPLAELQDRVAEELLRRTSDDARVPLDRDPVPTEYQEAVRRYYERIGSGQ